MSRFDSKSPISPGTGLAPGSLRNQRNRQLNQRPRQTNDSASFANYLPPKQTNDSASFAKFLEQIDDKKDSGVNAIPTGGGGGGSNKNIAEQVLGFDTYAQALRLGYKPSELLAMVSNARQFDRGLDVDKFKTDLNRYEGFLDADGGVFKFPDDEGVERQFLSVSRPELSANAPEGIMGLLGALGGPFVDMLGSGLDFIGSGGVGGRILNTIQDKIEQGKGFLDNLNQPGTLGFRVRALTPEQRRRYDDMIMSKGISPFQAIELAEKVSMATGGIATLQ